MIARVWHGWTSPENADRYEALIRSTIFPGIRARGIGDSSVSSSSAGRSGRRSSSSR